MRDAYACLQALSTCGICHCPYLRVFKIQANAFAALVKRQLISIGGCHGVWTSDKGIAASPHLLAGTAWQPTCLPTCGSNLTAQDARRGVAWYGPLSIVQPSRSTSRLTIWIVVCQEWLYSTHPAPLPGLPSSIFLLLTFQSTLEASYPLVYY